MGRKLSGKQLRTNLQLSGSLAVTGSAEFIQTDASDNAAAIKVNGRIKMLEQQIGSYIASASIQIGDNQDTIDCGGFF
tara:strand:+ start:298 stop:531 length:234 start_codon:yes stop_codon:yes gene_type:complete